MSGTCRAFLAIILALLVVGPVASAEVPQDDRSDPPATTSAPTGHPWLPIIGPFADESTGFETVTAWQLGFAMTRSGDRIAPEVWRSRDGRRWRSSRAPVPAGRIAWVRLWASGVPVGLIGEDVTYPSPQSVVDAVVTDPAVAAFLAAHPLEPAEDCCDFQDLEGIGFAPRGHRFAELGFAGGTAPDETIGVSLAAEDGRLLVRLDSWTGETAE